VGNAAGPPSNEVFRQMGEEEPTPKSERTARTFDSIGRRNETLRAKLDRIEFSFRNIEAIRTQFHDALTSIDETLAEIEHTSVARLEAERKVESLTAANGGLKSDRTALTDERDALAGAQNGLLARITDLEKLVTVARMASSEARATLEDKSLRLERAERELEDNRRALHALSEQLPAIRAEFVNKEGRLHEAEGQRMTLNDRCGLLMRENDTLRARIDELVVDSSKLSRQLSELEDQRGELKRLLEEVETSLGNETAAHAKLKAAHHDVVEAQRLNEANLQEKLAATTTRLEAAEQLLEEARAGMHDQDATIRELEQSMLEKSLAAKSLEAQLCDLEKDLASARASHVDAEVARTVAAEQLATLVKTLQDNEVDLQRAQQRVATAETRLEEYRKAALGDRASLEEEIASLMEQLEKESAARLFAEGALHSARQERGARREESREVPAEAL
jgi:crescentin